MENNLKDLLDSLENSDYGDEECGMVSITVEDYKEALEQLYRLASLEN